MWGGGVVVVGMVLHDDNDDTYTTPQGRPDFVVLGLKTEKLAFLSSVHTLLCRL